MLNRGTLPLPLRRLADDRGGVLTRVELLAAGLSRHTADRLSAGWRRLGNGVYLIDPGGDEWLAKVFAGVALGGDRAAASGATAVALWGLGESPGIVEVLTPTYRSTAVSWLRFRRENGQLVRRIVPLAPPRVNLEDAVVDTAAAGTETDALAIVSRAIQDRRTTPEGVLAAINRRNRVRHRSLLVSAIGDSVEGAHSAPEHLFHRLLIELDGLRYHDPQADRMLDNRHGAHGYITLRYGWDDVSSTPCCTAQRLSVALTVPLRTCRGSRR